MRFYRLIDRGRSLIRPLLVAVVVLQTVASAETQDGIALEERVVHFPLDQCLGRLKIYTGPITNPDDLPGTYESESFWSVWDYFCEARGDVVVPTNKQLRLHMGAKNLKYAYRLRQLRPDDLYSLVIDCLPGQTPAHPDQTVMPYLSRLTGLKELATFHVNISGRGLRHVRHLNSLRVLKIYYTNKSLDTGLPYLTKLKSLEHLDLDSHCTDSGLKGLAGSTTIKKLSLSINHIQGPGLVHLEKLPALRSLTLIGQTFSDDGLAYIKNLTLLKHLHLFCFRGDWPVTDAGLAHLSGLTQLEELEFTNLKGITDAGLVHLKPLRSLRKLKLSHSQITDVGLAQLKEKKSLESLKLPGGITDTGLAYLCELGKLKELRINSKQMTDEGSQHLAKLRSLEELSIGGPGVSDTWMDSITQLTNLRSLGLGHRTQITEKSLAKLAPLKSLKTLSLSKAKITISGLAHLNALPNLTRLRIGDIKQDNTGMNLSGLTKLEELMIYPAKDSQILDRDLACLAKLKNLRNLQFVYPNKMAISDQGLRHLAGLTNLDTLVVGSNLTDAGLDYLENMKKLQILTISGDFTDQGLRRLERLKGLGIVRIISECPFSHAAQNRLQNSLPNLYSFQVTEKKGQEKKQRGGKGLKEPVQQRMSTAGS